MARRLLVAAALLGALLALAGPALADGDPASDYLLGKPLFVPQDAGVPDANVQQLTGVIADARARGYTIRVALIGTRYDMGSVYELWREPKTYARFLGAELHFLYKGRLLTVMPNGYGYAIGGKAVPAQQAVLDRLPPPGKSGAKLANGAARAVQKLAAQAGVIVTLPKLSPPKESSANHDRVTIGVAVAVLVVLAGLVAWGRRLLARRRRAT